MELPIKRPEKIKLTEINPYLTCYLCKGYLIDATTISECLHSFCRSCIIKFLQDNSYCPVCEVIINKAKPNLKLDKTLQDIVYKLVPELFLREMTRRREYYKQYPQIAARVSPEERGEDTERTIFNPRDCISLSLEYVSDDSTPGAISLNENTSSFITTTTTYNNNNIRSTTNNDLDKKSSIDDENSTSIKRYLQCPGMCRIEVIKKFVQNKYNVDSKQYYIDILYKKVPLPDHYTLIDIAYIYSWKRNEPMRFFFRIIDSNQALERFDSILNSTVQPPLLNFIKTPVRPPRCNGERSLTKKREAALHRKNSKIIASSKQQQTSQENNCNTNNVCDKKIEEDRIPKTESSLKVEKKEVIVERNGDANKENEEENKKQQKATEDSTTDKVVDKPEEVPSRLDGDKTESSTKNDSEAKKSNADDKTCDTTTNVLDTKNNSDIAQVKNNNNNTVQSDKSDIKKSVYTNVHLNRTNNVEIITKFQKVSNKDGKQIATNIIDQLVKKNTNNTKSSTSASSLVTTTATKSVNNKKNAGSQNKTTKSDSKPSTSSIIQEEEPLSREEEEKIHFMESIQLVAVKSNQTQEPKPVVKTPPVQLSSPSSQKRKNTSPIKNDQKHTKKLKAETKKSTTKHLNQPKPRSLAQQMNQLKGNCLQSLIENCKIPSSLSITIKEGGSDSNRLPLLLPPVKNYIEILKLPDEDNNNPNITTTTTTTNNTVCDNDSEQKVDQDLSEIAKSLTEKIPMSTTISQIVGPKPQYPIPIKSNAPAKFNNIQPSPVPELTSPKVLNVPKDNNSISSKLSSKIPQTFQKIFEESIKKPDGTSTTTTTSSSGTATSTSTSPVKETQKSALDLTSETPSSTSNSNNINNNNGKRNILEIASQLYKKTKLEQEKKINETTKCEEPTTSSNSTAATTSTMSNATNTDNVSVTSSPKVAIPRLPNQRTLKPPQKNFKFDIADPLKYSHTLTSLHSNALGMNYSVSIGQNNKSPKSNGVVTPPKNEDIIPKPSNKNQNSSSSNKKSPGSAKAPSDIKHILPSQIPAYPAASPRPLSIPRNMSPSLCYSPRNSPKHSPKSSPLVKHMYAPMPNLMMDQLRVHTYNQRIPSPNKPNNFPKSNSTSKLPSSSTSCSPMKLPSPSSKKHDASSSSLPSPSSLVASSTTPISPKIPSLPSPLASSSSSSLLSPICIPRSESPKVISLPEIPSPSLFVKTSSSSSSKSPSKSSPGGSGANSQASPMSPNQILEKYNIQNLAQLTASLNFNPNNFGMNPNQLAALQHAMLLKHFEMQNRQNWLNMNQGPLLQYEKYLQSLKNNQNHLLTKEN